MMEVCHKVMMYKSGPRSDPSDLSKGFEADDILGVPQAIKGFDKSDFCEVVSIYLSFFHQFPNIICGVLSISFQ